MTATSPNYAPRFLPARLPRVCVAIAASNPVDMVQKADVIVRDNPFIEFRLDYLPKPALALVKLKTFAKMQQYPADFIKVVSTANSLYDNVVMMKFLEKYSHSHSLVGVCMGEQGVISRLLAVRAGSQFTFGALSAEEATAPGQIAARALLDTYRIDQVDAATRVYGVAGDPVAHSLSPAMLNTAFRRENVNAVYLALHAKTMEDLMACVQDIPIAGLSITMPYKEPIVKQLDKSDPWTAKVGACNT